MKTDNWFIKFIETIKPMFEYDQEHKVPGIHTKYKVTTMYLQ